MLRKLFRADLDRLLSIENSVHISPWTEETFKICFQVGYEGWVIEMDKIVIGFIVISINKEECHILNLSVVKEAQHHGWGSKLLEHALSYAKQKGIGVAYLEVRRSNTRAIQLYRKLKFHFIAERKNYYPTVSGHEDALIFAKILQDDR